MYFWLAGLGENNRPIALIGHSLGGLIIDCVRVKAQKMGAEWPHQLKAIVRFGVPTLGAKLADVVGWLPGETSLCFKFFSLCNFLLVYTSLADLVSLFCYSSSLAFSVRLVQGPLSY